jgi:hypothetical protein
VLVVSMCAGSVASGSVTGLMTGAISGRLNRKIDTLMESVRARRSSFRDREGHSGEKSASDSSAWWR